MTDALAESVYAAFRFLADEYGFRRAGVERVEEGVLVKLKNNTTGIKVWAGRARAGVTIGRLDRGGRFRMVERDDFGHWWWIVQDLVPSMAERERLARRDADVPTLLAEHAEALRRHGGAVLQGDFSAVEGIDWWQMREEPVDA